MGHTDVSADAEAYSPSLAARQFGLIQAIPVPFVSTCNEPWQDRHSISLDKSFELHQQSLKDLKSFKFYPFKITPDVTPTFSSEDAVPTAALKSLTEQLLQDKNFNKPLSSRVIQRVNQLTGRAEAIQKGPVDQEPIQRAKRQHTDGSKTSYEPKKSKGEKKNREEIFDIEDNVFEEDIETEVGIEEEDPSLEIVARGSHSALQSLMSPGAVKVSNVETIPTYTPIPTLQQVDHDQLVEDVAKMIKDWNIPINSTSASATSFDQLKQSFENLRKYLSVRFTQAMSDTNTKKDFKTSISLLLAYLQNQDKRKWIILHRFYENIETTIC
ncbi:hypothetical protein SO802_019755 [Lithocarpus litseifolius]|uniref:Uncharacterized protein n=1 Tax=Lithocarpus litseifolius TaxID=425828 RepID=A0AAW2CPL9_9ROSI